ncbi:hypothetical protein AC578_545 [Pseudocercospora eumusae]|uniref:Uncharacterized protein n=1 Tax=Pseudocercospora eumusae TaxID=321146 RepID=A0A139HYI6_9PEZI|nr:hypothetical protein AC578_545 [Pseudocercospora eumusae]
MGFDTMRSYEKFLLNSMLRSPPAANDSDNLKRQDSCMFNEPPRQSLAITISPPSREPSLTENINSGQQRMAPRQHKPQVLSTVPSFQATKSKWSPPTSPGAAPPRTSIPMARSDSSSSAASANELSSDLYMAACVGDISTMQIALDEGASINSSVLVPGVFEAFKPAKPGHLSALAGAASYGNLATVQYLVANGAEVNACSQRCASSPLHQAIRRNNTAIVRFLLEHGADINLENAYRATPVMYACKYSGPELLKLLLQYKPDLTKRSFIGGSAIHWSIWPGKVEMTELLLKAGADPCEPMPDGNGPLHCAIVAGSARMVKTLLKYGANPYSRNEAYETPLQLAQAQCGNDSQIVAMLKTVIAIHARRQ